MVNASEKLLLILHWKFPESYNDTLPTQFAETCMQPSDFETVAEWNAWKRQRAEEENQRHLADYAAIERSFDEHFREEDRKKKAKQEQAESEFTAGFERVRLNAEEIVAFWQSRQMTAEVIPGGVHVSTQVDGRDVSFVDRGHSVRMTSHDPRDYEAVARAAAERAILHWGGKSIARGPEAWQQACAQALADLGAERGIAVQCSREVFGADGRMVKEPMPMPPPRRRRAAGAESRPAA